MPTQKGITLTVISQWELQIHPEFPHPDSSQYTGWSPNPNSPVPGTSPDSEYSSSKSDRILGRHSTVAVYIPSVSGARFWLRYGINEAAATTSSWYYFKLFMNGRHITSWGANTITQRRGQIMRGLFEPSKRWNYKENGVVVQKGGAEVRPFFFAREDTDRSAAEEGGLIEVMVFRARGRKRRMQQPEEFRCQDEWGIVMPTGGLLEKPEDAKFYDWHLRDPTDKPFATFQFHYRSWDSLMSLSLIPADHTRSLLPASPSLLSLNGHPREQQSPPKAEDERQVKICVDELQQEDEYRDSVSSNASNTPWMTSVFEDKPDPGAKNPGKPAELFKLPITTSSYPLRQALSVPLSRFSLSPLDNTEQYGGGKLDDKCIDPVKRPPAPADNGNWDALVRALPEIPTRTSSLNRGRAHTRTPSAHSNAMSITPSLRSYADRDTNSPEPFVGMASIVHVVASTFGLNDDVEKRDQEPTLGKEPDVNSSVGDEDVPSVTPPKRPLGGVFDVSNITLRKHRRSSPTKHLSSIKQSPIYGSESSKSSPKQGSECTDAEASMLENNTTMLSLLSEGEWMCRTPSPVREKGEKTENLRSRPMKKLPFRDSLDANVLRMKASNAGARDEEALEDHNLLGEAYNGDVVRMRSGNWI